MLCCSRIHECGIMSESSLLWFKSPKKCAKNYPKAVSTWENAQNRFGNTFWEVCAKLKNFLRLSHLHNTSENLSDSFHGLTQTRWNVLTNSQREHELWRLGCNFSRLSPQLQKWYGIIMYRENDPIPRNNIEWKVSKGIQCCDIKHFICCTYPVL